MVDRAILWFLPPQNPHASSLRYEAAPPAGERWSGTPGARERRIPNFTLHPSHFTLHTFPPTGTIASRMARTQTQPSKAPRILIVRPSALGDVSRTVGCAVELRRQFPQAEIHWLVARAFADVVRHHPAVDAVVLFDRAGLRKFGRSWRATRDGLAFARQLRRAGYDRVYDLQGLFRSGLFTRLTGAPYRCGFANSREGAAMFYTHKYHVDPNLHTVDRMMSLLTPPPGTPGSPAPGSGETCGGASAGSGGEPDLRLYVGEADQAWGEAFCQTHQLAGAGGYMCLAPTAQWGCKCWPIEFFARLADRLLNLPETEAILMLAAAHERPRVDRLFDELARLGRPADELRRRVLFPATTVGQMMALIRGCRLLVCNDSAALHIAVGLDRPFVAIHGPTDPRKVGPYHHRQWVLQPPGVSEADMSRYRKHKDDDRLIRQVSVDAAWAKVCEVLSETR